MGPKSLTETDPFSRLACQERSFSAAFATFGSKGPTLCVNAGIGVDMKGEMWRDMILTGEAERNMAKGKSGPRGFQPWRHRAFSAATRAAFEYFALFPITTPVCTVPATSVVPLRRKIIRTAEMPLPSESESFLMGVH